MCRKVGKISKPGEPQLETWGKKKPRVKGTANTRPRPQQVRLRKQSTAISGQAVKAHQTPSDPVQAEAMSDVCG